MFSGKAVPSVGVSVGIERVFSILEERAGAEVRATSTQIFVAQASKNLTTERMKLLNEFWSNGIAAETLYSDNPKAAK
jgi:histidyl-tRNA synthetase